MKSAISSRILCIFIWAHYTVIGRHFFFDIKSFKTILILTEPPCGAYLLKELSTSSISHDSNEMCGVQQTCRRMILGTEYKLFAAIWSWGIKYLLFLMIQLGSYLGINYDASKTTMITDTDQWDHEPWCFQEGPRYTSLSTMIRCACFGDSNSPLPVYHGFCFLIFVLMLLQFLAGLICSFLWCYGNKFMTTLDK